jgi:type IV fimbrial biogenesis protein FimT
MEGKRRRRPVRRWQGYTLIELVLGLAVVATTLAWGVPSFGALLRDTTRTREINQFLQAVYVARSEAIKRNGVVSLCPSRNRVTCSPSARWTTGWLIFVNLDRDSPAVRDAGEPLLRVYESWDAGHITSNRSTLSFRPFGQMGVTATVTFCDDRGARAARAVIISQTGRPRISRRSASGGSLVCT